MLEHAPGHLLDEEGGSHYSIMQQTGMMISRILQARNKGHTRGMISRQEANEEA